MIVIFIIVFFASYLICLFLIKYQWRNKYHLLDTMMDGVQKFHSKPVPRVGGLSIFCGLCLTVVLTAHKWDAFFLFYLLIASLPAFLAGFLEDITKKVSPLIRLLATFGAAMLGFWLLRAGLNRIGLYSLDIFLEYYWIFSLILTIFAVGGISHAVNIIDGYNGLASMVSIMILLALAYISSRVGNFILCTIALGVAASVLGFFVWNYPRGLIFLGDGGAYLLGFLVAELSVLLITFHREVSPFFPLLLLIYPVIETLFSIYRRKIVRKTPASMPDALHLHTLIHRRIVKWTIGDHPHLLDSNSLTSPYLWVLSSLSVIPACLFWNDTYALIYFIIVFIAFYISLYTWVVKFKTPKWMKLSKR